MKQSVVILFVLHDLGDGPVTTEDIAVEAFKRCPEHFALPKHPEYPNIEAVRKRLQSEMSKTGLVQGSQRKGWLLTACGYEVLEANQDTLAQGKVRRKPNNLNVERVKAHPAFLTGQEPEKHQILESLGCNVNTEASVIQGKMELLKTRAHVLEDEQLVNYLAYVERRLRLTG